MRFDLPFKVILPRSQSKALVRLSLFFAVRFRFAGFVRNDSIVVNQRLFNDDFGITEIFRWNKSSKTHLLQKLRKYAAALRTETPKFLFSCSQATFSLNNSNLAPSMSWIFPLRLSVFLFVKIQK